MFRSLLAASFAALLALASAHAAEVNVYSARHYGSDQALWDAFTKATGVKVNVVEAEHDQLLQRLKSEGAGSPADVLITVDAGRLATAVDAGLLQPVKIPSLEAILPAHLRHPEGYWYGVAVRARVLVYHKDRVKPSDIPTYEVLAEPKFKGKLLVRSGTNIYNLGLVGSMIAAHGPEKTRAWARGIVANLARPPQGGDSDQIKAVAAGVGDVAISNSYYFARLLASEKPEDRAITEKLGVVFPNQGDRGTHVNISGAAVTKGAPNKANAVKLIEFLLSPEAQTLFTNGSLEFPANPKVTPNPILIGFGTFKQDQINAAAFAKNSVEAARIMDEVGWK
ncbi:MAG: Fe(3+) ABC transporter substrate-binding protein [Alphaproteobacteria bacterium]|nr:Fe(3+) ABC transporter substrate-binding protein [Alphaproteobacteria bacterium]